MTNVRCVCCTTAGSCTAMIWVPWLADPGYRMGVSEEAIIWDEVSAICEQYDAIQPEDGVQVK